MDVETPLTRGKKTSEIKTTRKAYLPAAQAAKTTLFAAGNGADVRDKRAGSAFGRREVDRTGAVQGRTGAKRPQARFADK